MMSAFKHFVDLLAVLILLVLGIAASLHFSSLVAGHLIDWSRINIWFDADTPRVFNNLIAFGSDHYRTQIHPASSILTHTLVEVLVLLGGTSETVAVRVLLAIMSGASLVLIYAFSRVVGVGLAPSLLFSALFCTSAAFIHWSGVPELFVFSMVTISLLLLVAALGKAAGRIVWILTSALTLSITITNWMFGIIAAYFVWGTRQAIRISVGAFLIVCILSLAQYALYENARLFFNPLGIVAETEWTQISMEERGDAQWTPLRNLWSIAVTTMVTPVPAALWMPEGYMSVSNHFSSVLDAPILTRLASAAWIALFLLSGYAALALSERRPIAYSLVLMLAGQAALHLVYGFPTFLFALHFLPVLIGFVVLAYGTTMRVAVLLLTLVVCIAGGISNYRRFLEGIDILESII